MKLLGKIIKHPESPWVQLVMKRYLHHSNFFDHTPTQNSSWQWKKLMSIREIFKKGLRWIIGSGTQVLFWKDNWCSQTPLLEHTIGDVQNINIRVAELILHEQIWNVQKLKELVPVHIVNLITSIPILDSGTLDKIMWGLTSDGIFSTKFAGWLAQGLFNHLQEPSKFFWIWNLDKN